MADIKFPNLNGTTPVPYEVLGELEQDSITSGFADSSEKSVHEELDGGADRTEGRSGITWNK